MSVSTVARQSASPRTRVCPICEKKFKYLSAHLKNTHKLTTEQERAPHMKRSLSMESDEEWLYHTNIVKRALNSAVGETCIDSTDGDTAGRKAVEDTQSIGMAVKRADTVLEEGHHRDNETADRKKVEFYEQERKLALHFQEIEDHIVALHLQAAGLDTGRGDPLVKARVRLEVREHTVALYRMATMPLRDMDPPMQLKRVNDGDNGGTRSPKPKRRKKRTSKPRAASDVRSSGGGLDYLENGLVCCQLCKLTWDGNAQHDCPYYDAEIKDE
jgi:hypothetical protein